MRPLTSYLPESEFAERHGTTIQAAPDRVYLDVKAVSLAEIPVARALAWLRRLGRGDAAPHAPFLETALRGAVMLEDVPGEGVVLGLTGQFWRLRGAKDPSRPRTPEEFAIYSRADACKAVFDFRVEPLGGGRCRVTTETRVHVADEAARRAFRRYWFVVRPFSGLIRIALLRAIRRRAEAVGSGTGGWR